MTNTVMPFGALPPETKKCNRCGEEKPLEAFPPNKQGKYGRHSFCRMCNSAAGREWRASHPEQQRENASRNYLNNRGKKLEQNRVNKLRKAYGLSVDDFDAMRATQKNKCAICGKEFPERRRPYVDHDHGTGRVRGLLCFCCNIGIGYLQDDPAIAQRATMYLVAGGFHER